MGLPPVRRSSSATRDSQQSGRERAHQEQRRGSAGDMVVPPPSTRMVRRNAQEDKQTYRVMSVCRGLQPTTASLPFLLMVEFEGVLESIQSHMAALFFLAKAERD